MTARSSRPQDPSSALVSRLITLGVSEPQWRRAGRRHLRAIVRELPLFDTAWIDACLRDELITPLQAERLCSDGPLTVGPFRLLRQTDTDAGQPVFEGRHPSGRRAELVPLPAEAFDRESAMRRAIDAAGVLHPQASGRRLQWVRGVIEDADAGWAVFGDVGGMSLWRRLAVHGRMSPGEVLGVAAGLLQAVAEVESLGLVHGDIRAGTVRIGEDGSVVLLRCPLAAAIRPRPSFEPDSRAELCDGMAPERIDPPAGPTVRSDLYAVGCLLWHLLAGRPPFPNGSALGKLRMHLAHGIPDVTDFAPDTPPRLSSLVKVLTDRDPSGRPQSARDALRFVSGVADPVRPLPTPRRRGRMRPLRAAALATTAAAVTFAAWPTVSDILTPRVQPTAVAAATAAVDRPMWPAPDTEGVIQLAAGTWPAQMIESEGPVVVRGAPHGRTIVEAPDGWELFGESVTLQQLTVRGGSECVLAFSQAVSIEQCRIEGTAAAAGVRWSPLEVDDPLGRSIEIRKSVFAGPSVAVRLDGPPREVSLDTTLTVGCRSVLTLPEVWPRRPAAIRLRQSTVRDAESLLAFDGRGAERGQQVRLELDHCVLDLDGAVVATDAETAGEAARRLVVSGNGSVAAGVLNVCEGGPEAALAAGRLTFAGAATARPADSLLIDAGVPLAADGWPGIRLTPAVQAASGEAASTR